MDASDAVVTLHGLDPGFREICDALYPGLEPRQVADAVYGISKGSPDGADTHVPSTSWRNGRGHTKGRGRRKIDTSVLSTRFVGKAGSKKDHSTAARNIGLGTTAVGTGISAVSLPRHLREIPAAMKAAKTGPNAGEGIKSAVKTVRGFAKPAQGALPGLEEAGGGVKAGARAVGAGFRVARENPRISAGLLLGATALHTANLGGEAIATHVLHSQPPRPKKIKAPAIQQTSKAWQDAQALIVTAHQDGLISKAEALDLGAAVHKDLFGHDITSGNIKLQTLKAPAPVKLEQPRLPMTRAQVPKPGKSAAGRKKGKELRKAEVSEPSVTVRPVDKGDPHRVIDISGEISKLNEDKQQCFGWCSVVKINGRDHIDKQNDLIDIDDIEDAAYDYVLHSRKGGDMHKRTPDGGVHQAAEMIESFVLTPEKIEKMGLPDSVPQGWWIGMQVYEPELWADVRSGKKTKFSIHGTGVRTEVLVDD
jgi:hypothetical protein